MTDEVERSRPDPRGHERMGYETCKRIFDLSSATAGLVALSPILATVAVVIKVTSPGPILYAGVRTGRHGIPFKIYKFRTMRPGAEALGTTTAKLDPRITTVGRVLRRLKLDELPQLFNVLRGDMSLVGPRPEVEEHTSLYDDTEKEILSVRPGITDYSSITFFHLDEVLGAENPHEVYITRVRPIKNQLRLKYVHNRSFREDLRILALTLGRLAGIGTEPGAPP